MMSFFGHHYALSFNVRYFDEETLGGAPVDHVAACRLRPGPALRIRSDADNVTPRGLAALGRQFARRMDGPSATREPGNP